MPKKLDPNAKPFQPIEKAFVSEVLSDTPPTAQTPPEPPPSREVRRERKVVEMPRAEQPPEVPDETPARGLARDHLTRVLKAKISASEDAEISRLVNDLSRELDTPISTTHVLRALVTILRHAEDRVLVRARQQGALRRPSNNDLPGIAAFEFRLAKLLSAALREAPPLRELPRE